MAAAMNEAGWEIASHGLKWIEYKDFAKTDEAAHIHEAIRVAIKNEADCRWLRLRLAFFDDLAIAIDDANARLVHRHVEPGAELHQDGAAGNPIGWLHETLRMLEVGLTAPARDHPCEGLHVRGAHLGEDCDGSLWASAAVDL
jgi:hypothetical protein